ncbi:MAG: ATP-binding cassette domain-containing protein [Trueperaceae bacterium]
MNVIVCDGLVRHFGDVTALNDLTLSVEKGEFFALLGPNGAGKSTTLHILTTMLPPSSGRAEVAGHDVVREPRGVRNAIGMVFQEPALDTRLTGRENLRIHAALYAIPRRRVDAVVDEALQWASLEEAGDRLVRTYSGGMKRRLELGRALMHEPKVLFLDEPTLGLDPQGRRHLWESIAQLRGRGLTVVMTTHNLAEAESCDRVGIIDQGRLQALGTPQELRHQVGLAGDATLEEVFLALTGRGLRDEDAGPRDRLLAFAKQGGEHTG